jgi:tRNA (mo5U34)-methyltransferase
MIYAVEEYRAVLKKARQQAEPIAFDWYPYDSLGNIVHLEQLLEHSEFDFKAAVQGKTILDLGCADGDFAFFLESLGARVVAVDHPRGNHNNLAGIRTLKEQLGSSVEVRTHDLDTGVDIGPEQFELTIALGLFYHLKNPILFLETLAKRTRFCLLSTRVMKHLPANSTDFSGTAIAYFLMADELNGDNSNFWIFTKESLHRVIERSHWKVLAYTTVGDTKASLPVTLDHDERAFVLMESTWGEIGLDPGEGWHEPEDSGWRWTAQRFTASAKNAMSARGVTASLFVPDALIAQFGPVTLSLTICGQAVQPELFSTPGLYQVSRRIPTPQEHIDLIFEMSHALAPDSGDLRERSVVVESLTLAY